MKKYFPYLIFFSAFLVSCVGSGYSIYGIGKVFGGHQFGATLLAFALEFGNIITAAALKIYWKFIPKLLKVYLISAVMILTCITSLGIYGYLADGFQITSQKDEIYTQRINLVKSKKENFQVRLNESKNELSILNNSILDLTKGLNTNTQTQSVDKKTGQVITNVIVGSKKSIDNQLQITNDRKNLLITKIDSYQDSIQRLDYQILEIQSSNNVSELGPLKYLSNLTGQPMNKIINWFMILLIVVIQPLAIALLILSLFAWNKNHYVTRKSKNSVSILDNIKSKFNEFRSRFQKKPVPANEIFEIPKRKRSPRRKKEEPPVNLPEPEPKVQNTRKRKVVDTHLTADLADHISKSLPIKKK